MKITHNKIGQNINTKDTKSAEQTKAAGVNKNNKTSDAKATDAAQEAAKAVNVQLSPRAQDIKKIKEAANNAPDVDTAKVEKFKKLIAEGKYKVDAKAVAEKMVDEHLKLEKAEA